MTWNDDDIITEEMAQELMERGACRDALNYVGWTVGKAAEADPWAALEYAARLLTPERLAWCKE